MFGLVKFRIEVIPQSAFGQNEVVAQFFTQVVNMHLDGVAIHLLLPTIDFVFKACAAVDVVRLCHQQRQQRDLFACHLSLIHI